MTSQNNQILSFEDCNILVQEYLHSTTFQVLYHEEFNYFSYTSLNGTNIKYVTIKIIVSLENQRKDLRFLAKHFDGKNEECVEFGKELFAYNTLFAHLNLDILSKLCFSRKNLLVFEDVLGQGFLLPSSPFNLDYQHIEIVLKCLSEYHAAILIQPINDIWPKKFNISEMAWFRRNLESLYIILGENGNKCKELMKGIEEILEQIIKSKSPVTNFLCHGFLWGNSILFKYDKNGKPIKCKLMNFEYQHYNYPTLDVLDFIYKWTSKQTRQHCLRKLLKFYYENITREIQTRNLDIEEVFPLKEEFETSFYQLLPIVKLRNVCLEAIQLRENSLLATQETVDRELNNVILELTDLITHRKLILEDCYKIVEEKLGSNNYQLLNYELKPLGRVSGFLGDHNKLVIDILTNNKKVTLNLFAKFMPNNEAATRVVLDSSACYKEIFFFEKIVKMLQDLDIRLIDEIVVPCYFTRHNNVVVFEDLEFQGYSSLDPRVPLTYDVVCMIIKKFANFHAASIILEEKLSEKTNSAYSLKQHYPKAFQESFFVKVENHMGAQNMQAGINAVEHILSLYPEQNPVIPEEEMKSKIEVAYEKLYELIKESKKFRNVVCHGDLWATNVMVKFDKEKPVDCRFIDFQLYRYCPPAHDLLIFIYLTTNRNFRRRYLNSVLDLYYKTLERNLSSYGYNVTNILSPEEFKDSIECMIPQAVSQTVIYLQLALINQDVMGEYVVDEETADRILVGDRREFISMMHERDPLFRERLGESVQDLREMCIKYF